MRPKGKLFDGSDSSYATQRVLVKNNTAGHGLCLTHFTAARLDQLGFVNRLFKAFCELDIGCALVGTYPACIARVLISHYVDNLRLIQLF